MQQGFSIFGVRLVGLSATVGKKVLFTLILFAVLWFLRFIISGLVKSLMNRWCASAYTSFWARQSINVITAFLLLLGLLSIWFDNPTRLATALGLVTAGMAFALQKVITSLAGYLVILRGNTFNVGDRISMGGVRGDVIALGFIQTTLMEMGEPPSVQDANPPVWVKSRQYTGRVVTITNDKVFDEPVYNYTRDFPYLWEEISIPITYQTDRKLAEHILQECAHSHTVHMNGMSQDALEKMQKRYNVQNTDLETRVYYRITDNWLELTVRFIVREHAIREIKDAISRDILEAFDQAGIGIASSTFDIVGLPPIHLEQDARTGSHHRKI
jgi:small-conductance mechanosensitive channel